MSRAFVVPRTLDAALDAAADPDSVVLGGGVAISLLANLGLIAADRFVSLARVPELQGVRREGGALVLGAATTHARLATDRLLGTHLPEVARMFGHIGNVRVRAWGTLGGNLALAEPSQDPPVFLAALDAEVVTRGPGGERRLPVAALSESPMTTVLDEGELITAVAVPLPPPAQRCAYLKFLPKTADDYATVSAAVRVRLDGPTVTSARLFMGAAGPVPVDCDRAVRQLVGHRLDEADVLEAVARDVRDMVAPTADHRGSIEYKIEMAAVVAARALAALHGRGGEAA